VVEVQPGAGAEVGERARRIITRLAAAGETLAAGESLTGGLLTAALTSVPGSSAVVRGGVVAYAVDVKATVLGVDPELLARVGPVHADVARAMAEGARRLLSATHGVATTGEAGPDSATGQAVGTVHVAISGPTGSSVASIVATGGRAEVRAAAVSAALDLLEASLG
jgi:nicotinamide-nucleotide amidase